MQKAPKPGKGETVSSLDNHGRLGASIGRSASDLGALEERCALVWQMSGLIAQGAVMIGPAPLVMHLVGREADLGGAYGLGEGWALLYERKQGGRGPWIFPLNLVMRMN